MSAELHRVALWLRLLLVCLVLTGVSAPAPTMGYREAVVAVATATARATEAPPATPTAMIRTAGHTRPAVTSAPEPVAVRVAPRRSPAPPRRIYLLDSALLC
jgi:hypothetical protein